MGKSKRKADRKRARKRKTELIFISLGFSKEIEMSSIRCLRLGHYLGASCAGNEVIGLDSYHHPKSSKSRRKIFFWTDFERFIEFHSRFLKIRTNDEAGFQKSRIVSADYSLCDWFFRNLSFGKFKSQFTEGDSILVSSSKPEID